MDETPPIFVDLERPAGLIDPVRVRAGDLLVFHYDPETTTLEELHHLAADSRKFLEACSRAGARPLTALILSRRVDLSILGETEMAKYGWVRDPGWKP